jgi:hypothetical protein
VITELIFLVDEGLELRRIFSFFRTVIDRNLRKLHQIHFNNALCRPESMMYIIFNVTGDLKYFFDEKCHGSGFDCR